MDALENRRFFKIKSKQIHAVLKFTANRSLLWVGYRVFESVVFNLKAIDYKNNNFSESNTQKKL